MALKYIVTGTGRCGTMFMSKFLTSARINCGHELIFTNEGIEVARANANIYQGIVADASYMAAPYLDDPICRNAKIIHLVRNPMSVINSFVVAFCYFLSPKPTCEKNPDDETWVYEYPPGADPEFKFMKFIWSHVPQLSDPTISPVERCAIYYIEWNKLIEQKCKGRNFIIHRIEDKVDNLCKFVGINKSGLFNDETTNKVEYESMFRISNIANKQLRNRLIKLGEKYGYVIKNPTIYML